MRVLLINGSSRKNGCTYTALSEVAGSLDAEGIKTEIMQIGTEAIRGCIGCRGCVGKGRCVFNDDVANTFIDKMKEADGLVIGSPVYYASANGNLVSLLDRMFFAGGREIFAYKPAAAVASARRAGTTVTLDEINKYFMISEMPVVSSSYWNMVHGSSPDEVAQDKEGLQIMRNLGRNMAWMLKAFEGSKKPENEYSMRTDFIHKE